MTRPEFGLASEVGLAGASAMWQELVQINSRLQWSTVAISCHIQKWYLDINQERIDPRRSAVQTFYDLTAEQAKGFLAEIGNRVRLADLMAQVSDDLALKFLSQMAHDSVAHRTPAAALEAIKDPDMLCEIVEFASGLAEDGKLGENINQFLFGPE